MNQNFILPPLKTFIPQTDHYSSSFSNCCEQLSDLTSPHFMNYVMYSC
jgi:hypothetical protein